MAMKTSGNSANLAAPRSTRRAPCLIQLHNKLLPTADAFTAVIFAYLCGLLCPLIDRNGWPTHPLISQGGGEILLCSVILSLALRESRFTNLSSVADCRRLAASLLLRYVIVLGAISAVELATLRPDQVAWLQLLRWGSGFIAWLCVSRGFIAAYCYVIRTQGAPPDGVAVCRAPVLANQLTIGLAPSAALTSILDHELIDFDVEIQTSLPTGELLETARNGELEAIVETFDGSLLAGAGPVGRQLDCAPRQNMDCGDVAGRVIARRPAPAIGGRSMAIAANGSWQYWKLLFKSIIDLCGASLLLCLLSPIAIVIGIAIVLDSAGPIIFRQQRTGWEGRIFTIFKFRTMYKVSDDARYQTLRNDPRCTRVGAILRRTSLDELPQLWNVLRGEMSLVGPRPHADMLHLVDHAGCLVVAEYAQRHRMKPGMTGWAQIHGSRGAIHTIEQMRARIEYDLYYIDHWSIWLDIYILFVTPFVVLKGENAF